MTPNFHRTTEQHSRLRGWSRMTQFQFKMADGHHIEKCLKCYNSSPQWSNLDETWVVASHHLPDDAVAMVTAVA